MIHKNPGHELDDLYAKWGNIDRVVVFAIGQAAQSYIPQIKKDISIAAIIDNNELLQGTCFDDISVISFSEYLEKYRGIKIIISTYYKEISNQLSEAGMRESVDFCDMGRYVAMWYWYNKKQIHLSRVNTSLTTQCTLKCKHCNMFMPYYKHPQQIDARAICDDYDRLFRFADKVYAVSLLGGEPLLYKEFNRVLEYIGSNYSDRIGTLGIVTNATVIPSSETFELMKKYKIYVQISDYSTQTGLVEKVENFKSLLCDYDIQYKVINSETWLDFGFPQKPWNITNDEELRDHFMDCFPVFRGLNDSKYYFCHICWSAEKAGLFHNKENDYIDLTKLSESNDDKLKLLEYSLGYLDDGFLSLCAKCGGCAEKNTAVIPAGEQLRRTGYSSE